MKTLLQKTHSAPVAQKKAALRSHYLVSFPHMWCKYQSKEKLHNVCDSQSNAEYSRHLTVQWGESTRRLYCILLSKSCHRVAHGSSGWWCTLRHPCCWTRRGISCWRRLEHPTKLKSLNGINTLKVSWSWYKLLSSGKSDDKYLPTWHCAQYQPSSCSYHFHEQCVGLQTKGRWSEGEVRDAFNTILWFCIPMQSLFGAPTFRSHGRNP